jgi:hypothetical protein
VNLGRDWELLSQDIRRSFALLGFRDATRAEAKFFDLRGTASREARFGLWDGPHPQAPQPLKSVPSSPGAKTPGLFIFFDEVPSGPKASPSPASAPCL